MAHRFAVQLIEKRRTYRQEKAMKGNTFGTVNKLDMNVFRMYKVLGLVLVPPSPNKNSNGNLFTLPILQETKVALQG